MVWGRVAPVCPTPPPTAALLVISGANLLLVDPDPLGPLSPSALGALTAHVAPHLTAGPLVLMVLRTSFWAPDPLGDPWTPGSVPLEDPWTPGSALHTVRLVPMGQCTGLHLTSWSAVRCRSCSQTTRSSR